MTTAPTPADLQREIEKLRKINDVLIQRIERSNEATGAAYTQFQRAATLEEEVRRRTLDLEKALDLLNTSNAQLALAHEETATAQKNLTNAIETIQEGFGFFDPQDRLVMCNSRFARYLPDVHSAIHPDLTLAEYVNLVSQSAYLELPQGTSPDDWARDRLSRHHKEHVFFNVRLVGNHWMQISEHRTPDGSTVILQTDVTDIMRLERQERDRILDDQARLKQATLEHLNQGVCIFDSQARLVGWNRRVVSLLSLPAQILRTGTRFETLSERLLRNATLTAGATDVEIARWVTRKGPRPDLGFELQIGSARTLDVHGQEMPDNGFVISFSDVTTERAAVRAIREANEQLEARVNERTLELADALAEAERANTSKSRFVAAASHDLLQPLSAAKLYLSSVAHTPTDPQTSAVIGKTSRALASVEHILEALLDISKLDSGRAALHVSPIRLDGVMRQLRDELAPLAAGKGLEFRMVESPALITSDATYLRRILQNLLTNAIRYTERGKVLFGARRVGKSIRVEVWDTGPGIPEAEQDEIFREFRRLNSAASAAEGMGLGLAIVERACALLSHPLELRSEIGRGTGFLVTLPLANSETGAKTAGDTPVLKRVDLSGMLVLLIENEASVREAMTMVLENRWDISVAEASDLDGANAVVQDLGVTPDAIIADYQLDHGRTGLEAIAELQSKFGPVPACLISANRSSELVAEAGDARVPLLHKPVDFDRLADFLAGVANAPPAGSP